MDPYSSDFLVARSFDLNQPGAGSSRNTRLFESLLQFLHPPCIAWACFIIWAILAICLNIVSLSIL